MRWRRRPAGALALALMTSVGCGLGVGRDLSNTPATQVVFDDMCQVQGYHDAVELKQQAPLVIVSANELTRTTDSEPRAGIATFGFESEAHLALLRRFLGDNYKRVPPELTAASKVEVRVKWAEKAGVRRVVTTEDPQITYGTTTKYLPYHICLSELFFGAPLYRTRREMLGIAPAPAQAGATTDAGTTPPPADGGRRDARESPEAGTRH